MKTYVMNTTFPQADDPVSSYSKSPAEYEQFKRCRFSKTDSPELEHDEYKIMHNCGHTLVHKLARSSYAEQLALLLSNTSCESCLIDHNDQR